MDIHNHTHHQSTIKERHLWGHLTPGSIMICQALWWLINHIELYLNRKSQNKKFRSRIWYPPREWLRRVPVEPILKATGYGGHILAHVFDYFVIGFTDNMLLEHATLLGVPFFAAVVEMLMVCGKYLEMFPNADFCATILMHILNAVFMASHSHHHDVDLMELKILLHNFLALAFVCNAIAALFQLLDRSSLIRALTYPTIFFFTGVWLIHTGVTLEYFNDGPYTASSLVMPYVTYALLSFVGVLMFYATIVKRVRKKNNI